MSANTESKPYVRKSVWANGGDFDDPILKWYALGVRELQSRPIADATSWRFLAAIHGLDAKLWEQYGYLTPSEPLPDRAVQAAFWNQCQHQTWYFIPWHRGYLLSLEKNVRAAIVAQGGPADWALPYWNYSSQTEPDALDLPPAFSRKTMPDGSPNPLYVAQRYGADPQFGTLPLPAGDVTLGALKEPNFTGVRSGGSPGFGGVKTDFSHSGRPSGALESKPHNIVHVDVGQSERGLPGLMAYPPTAALDPIFYLHHSNIDRLWEVWLARDPAHRNPTDPLWLNGPTSRGFVMPLPDGSSWRFAPEDVLTPEIDYRYSDISDPLGGASAADARLESLRAAPPTSPSPAMPSDDPPEAELIGANAERIPVTGASTQTRVQLAGHGVQKVASSLRAQTEALAPPPDRVFLNLENVRSDADHVVVDVFVQAPDGGEVQAGTFSLFGAQRASDPDAPHGGHGLTEVFEITDLIDRLHVGGALEGLPHLEVRLAPRHDLRGDENVSVGRVSVFRQG